MTENQPKSLREIGSKMLDGLLPVFVEGLKNEVPIEHMIEETLKQTRGDGAPDTVGLLLAEALIRLAEAQVTLQVNVN